MDEIPSNPSDKDKFIENASFGLPPVSAWFLGPKAEQADVLQKMLDQIFQDYVHWRRNYFPDDPALRDRVHRQEQQDWYDELSAKLISILGELKAHFPFYSPRYIGHMLSEQSLPSILGYFAGMLYNPNNVTDEAAPVTIQLELEVGKLVSEMLGYNPRSSWAHICSGGTTANLEALWVARNVQFVPLIVQQYCSEKGLSFEIQMPNGQNADIADVSPSELVGLKTNESARMLGKLAAYLAENVGRSREKAISDINAAVATSSFNPATKGIYNVLRSVQLAPIIYISAAAHYSVKKAANILGYGEESVCSIPVTERFRLDVESLREAIWSLPPHRYVAAVIGIAGTTEEGAVDPLHKIHFLQRASCEGRNRSFWFHVDAAWGGYFRSLFCGHSKYVGNKGDLRAICRHYSKVINAAATFYIPIDGNNSKKMATAWDDPEVYSAFLAMRDADSITIDPHKMGYVPYPAGIIAFKNSRVRHLMTQRAQYISEDKRALQEADEADSPAAVGPYVLEGSKPGAAAAGCWLAHTAIPLTHVGHGQIIKASALSARKLSIYLTHHRHMFRMIDRDISGTTAICVYPFTFVPLYEPDTNVVCFIALPMAWQKGGLVNVDMPLERINDLNQGIYGELSIPGSGSKPRPFGKSRLPYNQSFFVSRTRLQEDQYSYRWIKDTLGRLFVSESEYKQQGLFVLRSAVMNPLYEAAEREGRDYLLEFVKHLHHVTRVIIPSTCWLTNGDLKAG
jgi:glutamate/tyrosine decarboxylase-like PLP-dependent enzyme